MRAAPPDLPEIHRDDHLLVVAKPSGLLVHRGGGRDRWTALSPAREAAGRRVYPVPDLEAPEGGWG